MASREGMIFKFFEKWKKNRLNKFAKDTLKDNPKLEKDLKRLNLVFRELEKELDKK